MVYSIAILIRLVQDIIAESQKTTGKILLDAVAKHQSVNVFVDDKMISNLLRDKDRKEIHNAIRAGALRKEVAIFAKDELNKNLLPKISPLRMDDLCTHIIDVLHSDPEVSNGFCTKMQLSYADGDYLGFLTDADLYALSRSNLPREDISSSENLILMAQSNYRCPVDGKPFLRMKTGGEAYYSSFQVIRIFPDNLPLDLRVSFNEIRPEPSSLDSLENKIALCKICAEDYLSDPTPEKYKKLLECKNRIIIKQQNEMIAAESSVEEEIIDIIHAIAELNGVAELEPFSDVLRIREKIRPENYLLLDSVQDDVVKYYPFIQEQFSTMDGTGSASFDVIRSEIQVCYKKYERAGLNQQEIYAALIDWLLGVKGLDEQYRLAAGIIIAFFVQNCAVFQRYQNINDYKEGSVE